MAEILQLDHWVAFITLFSLEVVLGIDNVIFISILSSKLPEKQQFLARNFGLVLAVCGRIIVLLMLVWVMDLTGDLFTVFDQEISARDLILIAGGLFLLIKSVHEVHEELEEEDDDMFLEGASFGGVLLQIVLLDIVFSLDAVITAIGMSDNLWIMISAIISAMVVMLLFAKFISEFINRHPSLKMLALSFLMLIGVTLIADGLDQNIPKGYIYFALLFSVTVEALNLRIGRRRYAKAVKNVIVISKNVKIPGYFKKHKVKHAFYPKKKLKPPEEDEE